MKVLHVINTGHRNFGGKERATLELICGLRERNIDAQLLCLREGLTNRLAQKMGIPVFSPKVSWPINLNLISAVASYIRGKRFDIVHTHDFRENVIGRLAANRAKAPVVTTVHGLAKHCFDLPWIKRVTYHWLDMMTASMSERFIILSERDKNFLSKKVVQDKIHTIPVALKAVLKPRGRKVDYQRTFVIGSAGRLDRQKGFDVLAKAAKELIDAGEDVKFLIAGTGPREKELKELVKKLDIADRFKLLGFVEDMNEFYNSIDVFVLPSLIERMPLVILEAQAHGLFVIATDVGAIPEMIKDSRSGSIVKSGDHKALADAIKNFLKSQELMKQANPWSGEQNLAFNEMVEKTVKIYKEVLNK